MFSNFHSFFVHIVNIILKYVNIVNIHISNILIKSSHVTAIKISFVYLLSLLQYHLPILIEEYFMELGVYGYRDSSQIQSPSVTVSK